MMNTSKLKVLNSLVVGGLVAISMLMPLVAADLVQTSSAQQTEAQPAATQSATPESLR